MKIYDNNYDNEDYSKMMEDTGKMLNQLEFHKKQLEEEFETSLKIKLLTKDSSKVSTTEYEAMLGERNAIVNEILTGLKIVNANISYLKDVGCKLLVDSGVMTEEDFLNNRLANLVLDTMEEKNRDLEQIITIENEYGELKLNREVDMLVVIQDTNYNKDYQIQELEDTYNLASEEINHIDSVLQELDMIKYKLTNDIETLVHYITPKENDDNKTMKKGKNK